MLLLLLLLLLLLAVRRGAGWLTVGVRGITI